MTVLEIFFKLSMRETPLCLNSINDTDYDWVTGSELRTKSDEPSVAPEPAIDRF